MVGRGMHSKLMFGSIYGLYGDKLLKDYCNLGKRLITGTATIHLEKMFYTVNSAKYGIDDIDISNENTCDMARVEDVNRQEITPELIVPRENMREYIIVQNIKMRVSDCTMEDVMPFDVNRCCGECQQIHEYMVNHLYDAVKTFTTISSSIKEETGGIQREEKSYR